MSDPEVHEERDVREAFDAIVRSGPPVGFGSTELLAAGRRARRRRDLLTGAGVVGATAVVLGVLALSGVGPVRNAPVPAAARTPSPELVAGPIPGLSAAEAERAATSCRSTAAGVHPGARLYNSARDDIGSTVLLYGPGTVVVCQQDTDGDGGGGTGELEGTADWLPGDIVIDREASAPGRPGVAGGKAWGLAVGRASRAVARVEARFGTGVATATATVRPVNGTYVVRVLLPTSQDPRSGGMTLVAYDADGRLLSSTSLVDPGRCYRTPDGTLVGEAPRGAGQQCAPAVRWP